MVLWVQTLLQLLLLKLTLEQHKSFYIQIFFFIKYCSTSWSVVGWICSCRTADAEGWLWDLDICRFWYPWWVLKWIPHGYWGMNVDNNDRQNIELETTMNGLIWKNRSSWYKLFKAHWFEIPNTLDWEVS